MFLNFPFIAMSTILQGSVQVMENLESHGILQVHFPGLESHGISVWVMESHGKWLKMIFPSVVEFKILGAKL